MEELIQAVTQGAVAIVQQLYAEMGHGLGVAVVMMLLAWLTVERLTPRDWPAWANRFGAAVCGLAMTVLGHLVVPALSYGVGWRGVAAAIFYGILGGGAAWPFHDVIAKRFLPGILNSNPSPAGGGS